MVTETSEELTGSERRPAIWPWLVMPLAALALYFSLDRLAQDAQPQHSAAESASAPADAGIP